MNENVFKNTVGQYCSDVLKTLAHLNINQNVIVIHNDLHVGNVGLKNDSKRPLEILAAIADWGASYTLDMSKTIPENGMSL